MFFLTVECKSDFMKPQRPLAVTRYIQNVNNIFQYIVFSLNFGP